MKLGSNGAEWKDKLCECYLLVSLQQLSVNTFFLHLWCYLVQHTNLTKNHVLYPRRTAEGEPTHPWHQNILFCVPTISSESCELGKLEHCKQTEWPDSNDPHSFVSSTQHRGHFAQGTLQRKWHCVARCFMAAFTKSDLNCNSSLVAVYKSMIGISSWHWGPVRHSCTLQPLSPPQGFCAALGSNDPALLLELQTAQRPTCWCISISWPSPAAGSTGNPVHALAQLCLPTRGPSASHRYFSALNAQPKARTWSAAAEASLLLVLLSSLFLGR